MALLNVNSFVPVFLRPPVGASQVVVGQLHLVAACMCHASDRRCMPCFGVAVSRSKIWYVRIKGRVMLVASKLCCQAQQWVAMNRGAEALGTSVCC